MAVNPTMSPAALGLESLERLAAAPAPRYLSPCSDLSHLARDASRHLYSSLVALCPSSLPLDRLLTEDDFDAEQIWHQIEMQSKSLVRSIRRDVRRFEGLGSAEMRELFVGTVVQEEEKEERMEFDGREEEKEGEKEAGEEENGNEEEDEEEEEEEEDGRQEKVGNAGEGGLNDGFFDTGELEEFMKMEEAREYGRKEEIEADEEDEDDEDGEFDNEESGDKAAYARFEDFYRRRKTVSSSQDHQSKKKFKVVGMEEWDSHDRQEESVDGSVDSQSDDEQEDDMEFDDQNTDKLSTFERQSKKNKSQIEKIEKELVAPKSWTMLGEVTASKRPKNSALEVDLDFQHNRGRPPLATEENTASIEELILKRIREGNLDEVQRASILPSNEPKELKELDENKSQKGLAEIYEEEYAQKTGLASAPLRLSDEQKKEATELFKKLCFKLDALSHFHFTPKPAIEDMSIQANIPALAMEEIAPLAVSDAAMLAPEEVFTGKGDIKEEKELTKEDRKRRRAKKKRKFKVEVEKRAARKVRESKHKESS